MNLLRALAFSVAILTISIFSFYLFSPDHDHLVVLQYTPSSKIYAQSNSGNEDNQLAYNETDFNIHNNADIESGNFQSYLKSNPEVFIQAYSTDTTPQTYIDSTNNSNSYVKTATAPKDPVETYTHESTPPVEYATNEQSSAQNYSPSFYPVTYYEYSPGYYADNYDVSSSQYQIKLRAAAFFPLDQRFRSIYGNIATSYEVEGTTMLPRNLQGWINFNWVSKHTTLNGKANKTNINVYNGCFGLSLLFPFKNSLVAYLGIGPNFSLVSVSNNTICGHDNSKKCAVGGIVKSGIQYTFYRNVFAELFVDYLYQPVKFETRRNVGGLKTGIGLGMNF